MSEDKRNNASGQDAAKEKTTASPPAKSGQGSASSASTPTSGKASAPATDPKAAKAGKRSGSNKGKSAAAGTAGKSASGAANKSPPASPTASASSSSAASGQGSASGQGTASTRASAAPATPATPAARPASGSSGGGTPRPSASTGSGDSSGGAAKLVAIVAVLIALIAIVMSGWVLYRGQGQLGSVDSRLDTIEKGMQSNVQDVLMPRIKRLDSGLQSVTSDVEQQSKTLSALQKSLQQTQTRIAELAGQFTGNKNRWELSQIEALLQAANERLQLYNDPQGARKALSLANDAIARKSDPRLFKLRREIVNEIAALDALPDPDVEGLSLALGAMIEQVPDLPLASNVPGDYDNSDGAAGQSGDNAQSDSDSGMEKFKAQFTQGWDHFTDSVGNALSGMLTIRRSDGTQRALLPPDQAFFLSQNLQLELRSARLALLERDTQNYRDSLASARQWLEDYYDTGAAAVSKMQERIGQMMNVKLDWNAPDISGGLVMLRQMMAERTGSDSPRSGTEDAQAGKDDTKDNPKADKQAGEGNQ